MTSQSELETIPTDVEEMGIQTFATSNLTTVNITELQSLRTLVLGRFSLRGVSNFELNGLENLETLVILKQSFMDGNGRFGIMNCPKLKSIQIKEYSFRNYQSFELDNLPSLQSIEIGQYCFNDTVSFSLNGYSDELE